MSPSHGKAADYPDFEQALLGAQSKLDASHILRRGKGEASVYASTSRGYVRYDLFRRGDMWHWERKGPLSPSLPGSVEMIPDVIDLGWDPDMPMRAVAEEARVSNRERWEKLQAEFNRLGDEIAKVESEARVKYGPEGLRYASRGLQVKHEKLKTARDRVFEKLFAMTEKLSPRNWSSGAPAWWVAGKLTFDDLIRPLSEPLSVTPPLAFGATTPMKEGAREMGAVREVLESRGREGRRYEYPEWLEFECEPATPTPELEEMAREFKKLVLEFLNSYARVWSIDLGSLDEDAFVWNAYASIVGHGVGLWEGDGDTGLRGEDEKKIDKALRGRWAARGSLVGRLHELAHRISDECALLSEGAGGREASEAAIPTKAQLKIIEAFRARRLMGNPMRDSISTDGDTIYSYRMPIAGRTRGGGIWIIDPASAPSATTRNHVYGLQRTFTPAEIMGTRRAAEHDEPPETERAPAPAPEPQLVSGYAFYARGLDWRKIKNDKWVHRVISPERMRTQIVGYRDIDGSMHNVFADLDRKNTWYAQLEHMTRGAREFPGGPFTAWANDFPSPKDAIDHAQRAWGATHVDFHGTRNRPTVYGTKDGARWKKTLYKEKGKYHWPEKFARGPKKLRGAIELTPLTATLPPLTPPPRLAPPPMHRPPMSPTVPGSPPGPRRDPFLSETRRRGPKMLPRRIDQTELHKWSERDRAHVELRDKITGETIIEWWDDAVQDAIQDGFLDPRNLHASAFEYAVHVGLIKPQESWGPRRQARENPATDLQDAIPWVRVTRDPERYKEAIARAKQIGPVDDAAKVYDLVGPALLKEDQETFIVVLIDVRQNCRGVAEIHRGARSRVATSVLDVMRVVVASGAEGFIVCHNHPSGKAMPSDADRDLTKAIQRAAKPFAGETAFLDHVVVGAGEYFSFADNKLHRAKG